MDDTGPESDMDDGGARSPEPEQPRWFGLLWFVATTTGRRVALAVLLVLLIVMAGICMRRGGYFGGPMTTLAFWLAFILLLVLIGAVALLDMLVIRLKFAAAQRDLVRKTIDAARQDKDAEAHPPADN